MATQSAQISRRVRISIAAANRDPSGELLALPGLRLDPERPAPQVRGLIFRKPTELVLSWER